MKHVPWSMIDCEVMNADTKSYVNFLNDYTGHNTFWATSSLPENCKDRMDESEEKLFSTNSLTRIYLMPMIEDVQVKNNCVVIMKFKNGDIQKAVTGRGDTFSLEQGMSICITKELIASLGVKKDRTTSVYNKLLDKAEKIYKAKSAERAKAEGETQKLKKDAERNGKKQ